MGVIQFFNKTVTTARSTVLVASRVLAIFLNEHSEKRKWLIDNIFVVGFLSESCNQEQLKKWSVEREAMSLYVFTSSTTVPL